MSKVAEKRAAKVETIHDVAAALFAEHGFTATRMKDIADAAGMSKASLYHYFESKEVLLTSLVQSRVGVAVDELRSIVDRPKSAIERLEMAVQSHLAVFQTHSDIYTIYDSERFHSINRDTAERVDSLGREYERLWGRIIEDGIEEGAFRADLNVAVAVKAMLGACNSTLRWYRPSGGLEIGEVADSFVEMFLGGIARI